MIFLEATVDIVHFRERDQSVRVGPAISITVAVRIASDPSPEKPPPHSTSTSTPPPPFVLRMRKLSVPFVNVCASGVDVTGGGVVGVDFAVVVVGLPIVRTARRCLAGVGGVSANIASRPCVSLVMVSNRNSLSALSMASISLRIFTMPMLDMDLARM